MLAVKDAWSISSCPTEWLIVHHFVTVDVLRLLNDAREMSGF